ncbi:SURF1 family cytochrome oxidase biogenesis protein [Blastomonas sp. UPD001]|jgi:surfeit locus 1 family protein|uniref:SURF1 family cytochrome oxidase biogenesis protein n=1 Tax=Blastomonas sp. UPD001 TaxID=2217673 RepID=UPI000E35251D|nr:SURF1 family cytochrome oxidase biogenesis protein [Blastomonas sp. UPD001]
MKRLPLIPTLVVGIAIAIMIGLGIWQLQRMAWKEALLAEYRTAVDRPPVAWPVVPDASALPLYRRSSVHCLEVAGWRSSSGRSASGASGWVHIASCRTGAEGPGAQVVAGWSQRPDNPAWSGGPVSGIIAPDSNALIRLVAAPPVAGLQPVQKPSPEDIPNNHWAYAVQWFLFAGIAAVIYGLAVARRTRSPMSA